MNYRTFSDYERKTVYANCNGKCGICGKPVKFKKATIDHIQPLSAGGTNDFKNLQIACHSCNGMKSYLTMNDFLMKLPMIAAHNWKKIVKLYGKKIVRKAAWLARKAVQYGL